MRILRQYVSAAALALLGFGSLSGQKFPEKGVPLLENYQPADYGHPGKVWSIASAGNGIVYFAASKKLLEFDGERWRRYAGSKGFHRSLLVVNDSLLYAGADKDFGRWERNDRREFTFTSLNPFRASTKGLNEEYWGVHRIEDDLVFVSFNNIYVYRERQLTKIAAPSRFTGSYRSGERVYLVDETYGLYAFDGLTLTNLLSAPPGPDFGQIVGVGMAADGLLVVTRNRGTYRLRDGRLLPLATEVTPYLQRDRVFCFTPIDDTHYAFGTILNGVYITDRQGRIIQHLNKQKGLPNNTVLSMHYTREGKLWLGMDYGITAIHLGSDLAYYLDHRGQLGTGQTALLRDGQFYLGTNQGLYRTPWDNLTNDATNRDFALLPESEGQVWTLRAVDGELLMGHDRGLYRVSAGRLTRLHDEPGVLAVQPLGRDHLLTGNYNGVSLFARKGGTWSFVRKMDPIQGACNQVKVADDSTLWVNVPNYGIIRATTDAAYRIVDQQIFPADDFAGELPQLQRDAGRVTVVTDRAAYRFDPAAGTFAEGGRRAAAPPVRNVLPGHYLPDSLDSTYAFYPVYNGFALRDLRPTAPPPGHASLSIRSAVAFNNDSTHAVAAGATIAATLNNVRFHYLVPQQTNAEYRYRLAGGTDRWSEWRRQSTAEFIDLDPGAYVLHVAARIPAGVTEQRTFAFAIAPRWYQSYWTYLGYGLLGVGLLLLNYYWQRGRLSRQRVHLLERERESLRLQAQEYEQESLMQRQRALTEEIGTLKQQLRTKTVELARKAKENEGKKRLLETVRAKITDAARQQNTPRFYWTQLIRLLDTQLEKEDDSFSLQLEELHAGFLGRLNARFPDLTSYDLRLCAYLKSGLSSREIAEVMNVRPSSVNVSRSRLRKKLGLAGGEDLYKFLHGFA